MEAKDLIEKNITEIMQKLNKGARFTRKDIQFLVKFLREMADSLEKKLKPTK